MKISSRLVIKGKQNDDLVWLSGRKFSIRFMSWTISQRDNLRNSAMWHNTCWTLSSIQLQLQQRWDHEASAIVPDYHRMTSAHSSIVASTLSPAGWLILSLCRSSSLSGCTYPPRSCSTLPSTGLRSALDLNCHCPGRWGCEEMRRGSQGSRWSVDPWDEWNLVKAD